MAIPESQLETWSMQGSVTQSRDTYATAKNALENSGSPKELRDVSPRLVRERYERLSRQRR